jgi:hypothetical protein
LRCGTLQRVALPISVNCWVAMAKVFEHDHRRCKPQPHKQMELTD